MTNERGVGPFEFKDLSRHQLMRLIDVLASMLPPRRTYRMEIAHESECPCASGKRTLDACTCAAIDVTVHSIQ